MDFALRCNSLKCRAQLAERAVVTTCSHIFCLACAERLGLAGTASLQRICPACDTALNNPDDVVSTQLNPTEDYKTSVLSGLSPPIITECAGRALAFWSYQSSQEIIYQEFLAKSLTERYNNLSVQLDKIINDANAEIENLNQRLGAMNMEQDKLKAQNLNIAAALQEKTRKQQQTQELYDRLKRKAMATVTQSAAFGSADELLDESHRQQMAPNIFPGSYGIGNGTQSSVDRGSRPMGPPPIPRRQFASFHNQDFRSAQTFGATPSHRERLGSAAARCAFETKHSASHNNVQTQGPICRQPLGQISGNAPNRYGGNPAFGISAGMRKGTPQGR